MEQENLLVAIVGQPNSGKSTLFSLLTRMHQEVGNYPGLTTDAKSGHYHEGNFRLEVVDLPGTYSFTSSSSEERVVKNLLLLDRPEVVLLMVDASNIRRHLPFVLELLEMQLPTIICLNFMDVTKRRGINIDPRKLEEITGIPVVSMICSNGTGLSVLRAKILEVGGRNEHTPRPWKIDYSSDLEKTLANIENFIRGHEHLTEDFSPRWLAVKLAENDREARRFAEHHTHDDSWKKLLDDCADQVDLYLMNHQCTPKKDILEQRHSDAEKLYKEVVQRVKPRSFHFSDRIDKIVCHPLLGPIVLCFIMLTVFHLTFQIADGWPWIPLWSEQQFEWVSPVAFLSTLFHQWLPNWLDILFKLQPGPLQSLIHHGILAGMGGVIQFVPVIFVMFTMLALLEQSGYIARVAMVMDSFMRRFNLQGLSILPMVLGGGLSGGCAVPAIMATRTITNSRQRLLTILVIPMLNCGGKLPVYAMLIASFFASMQGLVMCGIVCISWILALLSAWFLGKTFIKGHELPLLLEIPSYQLPKWQDVLSTAVLQSGEFLKKAGTIILIANIFLWFLMTYPADNKLAENDQTVQQVMEQEEASVTTTSYAASIGHLLEPVGKWAGFNWKDNVALLGGMATKELIVSSMVTLYEMDSDKTRGSEVKNSDFPTNNNSKKGTPLESLRTSVPEHQRPFKALALLIFVMLYAPCSGTLVAIYRITKSLHWVLFSIFYNTLLAFFIAVIIYQTGVLLF